MDGSNLSFVRNMHLVPHPCPPFPSLDSNAFDLMKCGAEVVATSEAHSEMNPTSNLFTTETIFHTRDVKNTCRTCDGAKCPQAPRFILCNVDLSHVGPARPRLSKISPINIRTEHRGCNRRSHSPGSSPNHVGAGTCTQFLLCGCNTPSNGPNFDSQVPNIIEYLRSSPKRRPTVHPRSNRVWSCDRNGPRPSEHHRATLGFYQCEFVCVQIPFGARSRGRRCWR